MTLPEGAGVVAEAALRRRTRRGRTRRRHRPPAAARADEADRRPPRRPRARRRAVELVGDPRRPGHRQADPPALARREPRRHAAAAPAGDGLRARARRRRHARRRRRRPGRQQRRRRPRRHRQRGRPVAVEPGPADARRRAARHRAGVDRRRGRAGGRHRAARQAHGRRCTSTSSGGAPAFEPERFSLLWQRSIHAEPAGVAARDAARRAPQPGDDRRPTPSRLAVALLEHGDRLLGAFDVLRTRKLDAARIRVHGDLHLGQALWTGRDVVFIDFEGEPGRSIGERSIKRSPLADVAGMVRSFDYAGRVALATSAERAAPASPTSTQLERWRQARRRRGCRSSTGRRTGRRCASGTTAAGSGAQLIPPDDADARLLLDAHVVLKALYEVRYELANRPAWVSWPLGAIARLLPPVDDHPSTSCHRSASCGARPASPHSDGVADGAARGDAGRRRDAVRGVGAGRRRRSRSCSTARRCRWRATTTPARGSASADGVGHGDRYRIRLDGGEALADPASGWQPDGVFGPSAVVDAVTVRVDRRRLARRRPRRHRAVRAARRDVHAGRARSTRRSASSPRLAALGVTHGRADAAQRVPRRPQLGLRRRVLVGRAAHVRRARRRSPASSTPPTPPGSPSSSTSSTTTSARSAPCTAGSRRTSSTPSPRRGATPLNVAEAGSDTVRRTIIESAVPLDRGLPRRRAARRRRPRHPRPDGPPVPRAS